MSSSRLTAGVLIYQVGPREVSVLLVRETRGHDRGTWGIPKGRVELGEGVEEAARREVAEETGIFVRGALEDLGSVPRELGPLHAFAVPMPRSASPRPARPEVDRAELVDVPRACEIVHADQRALLDRLVRRMRVRYPRSIAWLEAEIGVGVVSP